MSKDKKTLAIKSKDLGGGKYEVEGVIFYCDSHLEAIRKYIRAKNE